MYTHVLFLSSTYWLFNRKGRLYSSTKWNWTTVSLTRTAARTASAPALLLLPCPQRQPQLHPFFASLPQQHTWFASIDPLGMSWPIYCNAAAHHISRTLRYECGVNMGM